MSSPARIDHRAIRQHMRAWRRKLSPEIQQQAAEQACHNLLQHPIFKSSQRIACYLAQENELNPQPFIQSALQQNKEIYLPRMHPQKPKQLQFLRYLSGDNLIINKYNIQEPGEHASSILPWELDMVLFPLVAYDAQGNRLGRGAGYYDRCFEFVFELPNSPHPHLVGYAYEHQQVAQLKREAWDVPMNYIVTPEGVLIA